MTKHGQVFRAGTVAHIEQSAEFIFGMTRRFESNLPKEWRLPLESRQRGRIEWRSGRRSINDVEGGAGNFLEIASAKLGDQIFKGPTLNAFHGSEVANWADLGTDATATFVSASGALAQGPGKLLFLESTAKGRDAFFYQEVERAKAGENASRVVFLPWYLADEYTMTWRQYCAARPHRKFPRAFTPTAEEQDLREMLAEVRVDPGQEWYRYRVLLTDEHLIGRRNLLESVCRGQMDMFRRYYPSTLDECFASSERSMFGAEAVDHYYQEAKPPASEGFLRRGENGLEFVAKERGPYSIWERPRQGHEYVIGADVASERGAGSDFSAAYVIHKQTLTVVASFHDKLDGDMFADALAMLGCFYNNALVGVERNHTPSVAIRLKKGGYPRTYHYRNPESPKTAPRPGWETSTRSRPVIIDGLKALCRDQRLRSQCRAFVDEMNSFVYWEEKHKWQAAPGKHDDRVMAMAIAAHLCDPRSPFLGAMSVAEAKKGAGQIDDGGDAYRAYLREQQEQERRDREALETGDDWAI
jgi:hypothetical protein